MIDHAAVDDGTGTGACATCARRTADYGRGLQHRRGRRHDSPRVRLPVPLAVMRPKCRSCGRVNVQIKRFTFSFREEISGNVFRRDAGVTTLCQGCWRRLTA